eukprot:GHRQ01001781.1.p1 GENE.GHRQ01001781.1~~GHRQ01001781.1.p1  ORF type:complete len:256 (+),score=63.08 GHRQ01001781.1:64-831(+)
MRATVNSVRSTPAGCRSSGTSCFCAPHKVLQRPRRATVVSEAASSSSAKDFTGLSSLRFAKPTSAEMLDLMDEWTSRDCNHGFAGASVSAPELPAGVQNGGFMITKTRKKVGSGRDVYNAAVGAVQSWAHLQLGWNCTTNPAMKVGATICSATQTVVPWSVLPARVTYMNEGSEQFEDGPGQRFALGMCSLSGHQLAGEERFAVDMHADGSVWYDVFLFSKPDTLLALVSLPVVKIMQIRYVNDSASAVAAAVKA